MDKKYEFTNETLEWRGRTLHRIRALRNFSNVKAGDLGGWVESERNLSHEGNCWLYSEAKAYYNSRISDDACVFSYAELSGNASAHDNARLSGRANASGNARLFDNARASGRARLSGNASAHDRARLGGDMYATRDIMYFSGLRWAVTISDNHIKIGCKVYTIDEWAKFSDKEIAAMSRGALRFWKRWKPVIMAAALAHRKGEE